MANPLLTTKLFPPPPREQLVLRPRLVERLESGLRQQRKLALVSAPAGFGKTCLVVDALRKMGCLTAWLSLDSNDNDPVRFWRYVVAALRRVHPGAGELAQAMLEQNQPPPLETVLTSLLNDLTALPGPLALVLDDYHAVESSAIHDSLNFLLDHLAPGVFLVITTRSDPPLALARRRGRMEMVEVRAAELRFTREEALAFLNQAMCLGLSASDVDILLRRTEGWIAGLQMAALAMQGLEADRAPLDRPGEARRAFINAFAGDDQYIGDYLVEEVLQRQAPAVQEFLLQTSILRQLCAPLCAEMVRAEAPAAAPAQEILAYLERANLFIVPLDNRQEWFRYHRLFADLLQRRLAQVSGPEKIKELHGRASRWYEQRELWAEAVDHALAAADAERAAGLVERSQVEMFLHSELLTFRDWILRLPRDLVLSRPALCVMWGWAALSTGHVAEAVEAVEAVERGSGFSVDRLADGPPLFAQLPDGVTLLLVNAAMLRASVDMTRLDAQSVIRRGQQVLDCLDFFQEKRLPLNAEELRSVAYFDLGSAYEMLGEVEQAAAAFDQAVTESKRTGNIHIFPMAISHLAKSQVVQGRLPEAAETYRLALENAGWMTGRPSPLVCIAHAGLGSVLYEWNELGEAREQFERALTLGKPWSNWESLLPAYLGLARVLAASGSPDQAVALLAEADRERQQTYTDQAPYPGFQAWKALILNDPDLLERAARRYESSAAPGDAFLLQAIETEQHLQARLWLALGRWEKARAILASVFARAQKSESWGIVIHNLVLQSMLALRQNQSEQALDCLERAVRLAEPGRYARSFVDEGAPAARLLYAISGYAGEKAPLARYAARLLAAFPPDIFDADGEENAAPEARLRPGQAPLAEPLTEREIEILGLVALGLTNSAIAARLVISPGTVKVHTNNIYSKLGVSSRTAAVAKARNLGILA